MNLVLTITEEQHKQLGAMLDLVLRSTGVQNLAVVVDLINTLQNAKPVPVAPVKESKQKKFAAPEDV